MTIITPFVSEREEFNIPVPLCFVCINWIGIGLLWYWIGHTGRPDGSIPDFGSVFPHETRGYSYEDARR
jgi:hypothetical protein